MKKLARRILVILLLVSVVLIITNPNEEKFLNRVAVDYGSMHHGLSLDTTKLLEMGESQSQSYLLFGLHSYRFGTITVSYLGILGTFVKLEVKQKKQQNEIKTV